MNNTNCLICCVLIAVEEFHSQKPVEDDEKLFQFYCKLLRVGPNDFLMSLEWRHGIIFCPNCKDTIKFLSQLHHDLIMIQNQLKDVIRGTQITILNSIDTGKDQHLSFGNDGGGRHRNFELFRRRAVRDFDPYVRITKLNSPGYDEIIVKDEPMLEFEDTETHTDLGGIVLPAWEEAPIHNDEGLESDPDYAPCPQKDDEDLDLQSECVLNGSKYSMKLKSSPNKLRSRNKQKRRIRSKSRFSKTSKLKCSTYDAPLKFDSEGNRVFELIRNPEGELFFGEIQIIQREDEFQCGKCAKLIKRLDVMKAHIKEIHLGLCRSGFKPLPKKKSSKIKINSIRTLDGRLVFHGIELKKVEGGVNECGDCGLKYKRRCTLLNHIRLNHVKSKHSSKHAEATNSESDEAIDNYNDNGVTSTGISDPDYKPDSSNESEDRQRTKKGQHNNYDADGNNKIVRLIRKPDGTLIFGEIKIIKLEDDRYKCGMCAQVVKNLEIIKSHIKEIHLGLCRYGFKTLPINKKAKIKLNSIRTFDGRFIFHGIELKKIVADCGATKWECGKCGCKQKNRCTLLDHVRYSHAKEKRPNAMEGKQGPKTELQTYRIKTIQTEDGRLFFCGVEIIKTEGDFLQCSKCEKKWKRRSEIIVHIQRHHRENMPFSCVTCGESYAYKYLLLRHERKHSTDKPFVCEICGKLCKRLDSLSEHINRVHRRKINHICSFCGKKFFAKKDFQLHLRTHTKEKPYNCQALSCGKSFSSLGSLKAHERTHANSGDPCFKCSICEEQFLSSNVLQDHFKNAHENLNLNADRPTSEPPITFLIHNNEFQPCQ